MRKKKPPVTVETRRRLAAALTGRTVSEETIQKMANAYLGKPFPPKCNKCDNRDSYLCAYHNMECFKARETVCFRKPVRRKEHPDYRREVRHRTWRLRSSDLPSS